MTHSTKITATNMFLALMLIASPALSMGGTPIYDLTVNLQMPFVSEVKSFGFTDRTEPFFGRAFQPNDEEMLWVFPRAPLTTASAMGAVIGTSVMPENAQLTFTTIQEDGTAITTNNPSTEYLALFSSGTATFGDIIPFTFPPTYPYVFATTVDEQVCAMSMSPNGDGDFGLYNIDDIECAALPSGISQPRLYRVRMRFGMAGLIYGQGAGDGVLQMDITEGISNLRSDHGYNWEPLTRRRRMRLRILDDTEGRTSWTVNVLIALYERPGSAYHGQTLLGVSSAGVFETLSLNDLLDTTIAPTEVADLEKGVSDIVQSSMFNDAIICGHSGDSDHIMSIVDIAESKTLNTIDSIDSTMNHIYHRGIVHPYGTTVYLFLVYGSATTPTSSALYYMNHDMMSEPEATMIPTTLTGDQFITDMNFFPIQGYITFIGVDLATTSGSPSDLYFKAQILCHKSCATCESLGENQCLTCNRGFNLEKIGSGDTGTCEPEELEQNEVEANCGGVDIQKCIRCEDGFVGFCEICKAGAGLDKTSERGSGEFCIDCPVDNCETCEILSKGNLDLLTLFRKNLPKVL